MENLPSTLPASAYIIIALIMIIANAGTEIIKSLIIALTKKNGKSIGNNPINFHDLEATVSSIHETLSKTDEKGTPLCYAPKAIELQQRTLDRLDTIIKLLSGNK